MPPSVLTVGFNFHLLCCVLVQQKLLSSVLIADNSGQTRPHWPTPSPSLVYSFENHQLNQRDRDQECRLSNSFLPVVLCGLSIHGQDAFSVKSQLVNSLQPCIVSAAALHCASQFEDSHQAAGRVSTAECGQVPRKLYFTL